MEHRKTRNEFVVSHLRILYKFMVVYQVEEEHFSPLSIRFIRTAERYLNEESLKVYAFSTIAWMNLRSELFEIYRKDRSRGPPILLEDWDAIAEDSLDTIDHTLDDLLQDTLTDQQLRSLALRLEGYSNSEIAERDHVSLRAVERRFERIRRKVDELLESLK